jgi:hypothetical protein
MAVWKDLIVCGTSTTSRCGFNHLIELTQNLIYNLVILTTFLATFAFAYAGILLITSGGNTSKKDEAKKMLMKVLTGFLIILSAWLIVYTLTSVLLKDGYSLLDEPRPVPIQN